MGKKDKTEFCPNVFHVDHLVNKYYTEKLMVSVDSLHYSNDTILNINFEV